MRVLLLSDPTSVHTIKWSRSLAESGLKVHLFGFSKHDEIYYQNYQNLQITTLGLERAFVRDRQGLVSKLKSVATALPRIKRIITAFQPDVVHAHYATTYGLMGALSGFHPYVLSVWGADIFDFPHKSFIHNMLVKHNLKKADKILSTSRVMVPEIQRCIPREVEVTPFGIDLQIFKPQPVQSLFNKDDIVIGTIKTLKKKYGIDYLIRAFKILKDKHPYLRLKLLIVGHGTQEAELKGLVRELGLEPDTIFTGRVNYDRIAAYHNMLSVFVSLSIFDSESFGVAVVEASACETPAVVSNVGGLPEVVDDGVTGFVVPARSPQQAAAAIEKLILDPALRLRMGRAGRQRVKKLYNWDDNVKQMIEIYRDVSSTKSRPA